MKFDLGRLAVLGIISAREKAAVDRELAYLDMDLAAEKEVRSKLVAEQRRVSSDRAGEKRSVDQLKARQREIIERIEDHEENLEVLRERATAAHRLRKNCEAWAAINLQNGAAE